MPAAAPSLDRRSARSAAVTLLLLAAALLGSLLAGASPASAHAALTGSDPKQGAVVGSAPKDVSLTFSEGVALSDDSIRVLDPKGKRVDSAKVRDLGSGNVVRYGVGLRSGLPDGTYTVAWQAVSADSHPVAGAFTFSIGAPSKTSAGVPDQKPGGGPVGALYAIARYLAYAGFVVLVGGAAFLLACWPGGARVRAVQRLVVQGWVALTASTLALLLLRTPYTGSGKLADAFDLGGLQSVLETRTGAALVSRLLLLGAAALFVAVLFGAFTRREDPRERRDLAVGLGMGGTVVAAGLAATWALAEHASTGLQPNVAMPVDVLHLLAVAAWLGGLATLLVALYRGPAVERAAVHRFSRVAFGSVVVLAATGVYQSWRQVGSVTALTSTSYGQLLLVKVALVAVLLAVGWLSRRWTARLSASVAPEAEAARVLEEDARAAEETADAAAERASRGEAEAASDAGAERASDGEAEEVSDAGAERVADAAEEGSDAEAERADAMAAVPARAAEARAGEAAAGGAPTGEAPAGEAPTGEAPAGKAPAGEAPAGETSAGKAAVPAQAAAPANAAQAPAGATESIEGPEPAEGTQPTEGTHPAEGTEQPESGAPDTAPADPKRAAQLARQRSARETARSKRVRDADPERSGLRRTVLAEAAVAVLLLAVTTALTSTEPGRTEEAARSGNGTPTVPAVRRATATIPFDTGGADGKGTARLSLEPGLTGSNTLDLKLRRPNGKALDAPEVKLAFRLDSRDLGPLPIQPFHLETGHWVSNRLQLPMAGEWEVSLTVRTSEIDQVTETKKMKIG
ncbi:copper resistance protein CopC [Streptomyces sp. NPDC002055]|uniref:copper resistance protein CopC n=1 Tax=Streptomyces sp. NPDC002055 TaxID=3154534 RepID=UPI003324BBE6